MDPQHRGKRHVHCNALPADMCQELLFIQRSLAVVGYRQHVQFLTLYELLLAGPQLLPVVAKARQLVWDAVEELFGLPCQVWPETTSLISWTAGASIGWHHDANRPYLAARHFSAVAYLNTQGTDFEGGTFCFQSGTPPLRVAPTAGTLLVYTADDSNVHSVEEVTAGERATLTLWFTCDPEHQEDRKVLAQLAAAGPNAGLPSTMYLMECGQDIRLARLQQRLRLAVHEGSNEHERQLLPHREQGPLQSGGTANTAHGSFVVRCMDHPELCCDGHASSGVCLAFSSVQEAVMAVAMLEWMLHDASQPGPGPLRVDSHELLAVGCCDVVNGTAVGASNCTACRLLSCLPEAVQRLEQLLSRAAKVYDQLLPVWHGLGALVPPHDCD